MYWYQASHHIYIFALASLILLLCGWIFIKKNKAKKTLNDDLLNSNSIAAKIISISADAVISVDEDQCITLFNEGAEKIFGYTRAEIIGKPLDILIPNHLRTDHHHRVDGFSTGPLESRRMGERGASIYGLRKNGTIFPADAAISKVKVGERQILTATLRDISEQKRIENEQRFLAKVGSVLASTLSYEDSLENIARLAVTDIADYCFIYVLEPHGSIKRTKAVSHDPEKQWICDLLTSLPLDRNHPHPINTVLEEKRTLVIEKISSDMIKEFSSNAQQLKASLAADLKSLIAAPLIVRGQVLGAIALFNSTNSRAYGSSDLYLVEGLAQRAAITIENTRLYRESQRGNIIGKNIPAMMAYWDKNQTCHFANSVYLEWFGIESEKIIGHKLHELLGPELYEKNRPYIEGALAGQRQDFERDLILKKTGQLRHTNASYIPEIENGKVVGFFVLVVDVTDLKEAQLTAIAEKEKAQAATKTREDVLTIVSHDLKNPLATIGLIADLLKKPSSLDPEKLSDYADRITSSVSQMQNLISDLLDFAKIQSGTFEIEKLREKTVDLITKAVNSVRTLAEAKEQKLEMTIPPSISDIACDSRRINQVLSNLLGNAIKFTPKGGTIRVSAKEAPNEIIISVSDTGPGIPPEQLSKVFDRFWQARETRALGSGLGLSIAKGIIDAHGTKIWVESTYGKGCHFFFTVPLANDETKKNRIEPPATASKTKTESSLRGAYIMIVDDSEDLRQLMRRYLENAGARVCEAETVAEAIVKIKQESPQIVITDIEMPGEDGFVLLEKIHHLDQKEKNRPRVMALTGHSNEKVLNQIAAAGFDSCLSKPVRGDDLVAVIQQIISRADASDKNQMLRTH